MMRQTKHSEKLEQKLREIHEGKLPEHTRKKKNLSRIILFADIVFILGILIFFTNRMHEKSYDSVSVSSGKIDYILSVSERPDLLTVTVNFVNKNDSEVKVIFRDGSPGVIRIRDVSEREIRNFDIAGNLPVLVLSAGESRTYLFNIKKEELNEYVSRHPEILTESQTRIFTLAKSDIVLNISLEINIEQPVSTLLKYPVEVR